MFAQSANLQAKAVYALAVEGNTPDLSEIESAANRVAEIVARLYASVDEVQRIADRLLGERPEASEASGYPAPSSGTLVMLAHQIDRVNVALEMLSSQISRLDTV